MTEYFTVALTLPPSVNHSHRNYTTKTGRRRRVLTKRAEDWTAAAQYVAKGEQVRTGWTCPQGEPIVVEYFVWWPDRRTRDPSNLEKLTLDALAGVAYDDDKWAVPRCIGFGYDKACPRLVVRCHRKEDETTPKWCYYEGTDQ